MSRWSARARTPNEGREGGREGFVEWEREERSMAGREGGREGIVEWEREESSMLGSGGMGNEAGYIPSHYKRRVTCA